MTGIRVARLSAVGQLSLQVEPAPVAGAGQCLVRMAAVGLCGSDLHWYTDGAIGDARLSRPLVLGHELAGVVQDGPLAGRLVAVDPAVPCGSCPICLAGHRNLCPTVRFAGHGSVDGGLRELLVWPAAQLHPVPEGLSPAETTVLEPLGVALHAMDLGHVRVGASVAVVGCGPIGLLLVRLARAAGAGRVVAAEPLAHRRAAAEALGADLVVDPDAAAGAEPEAAARVLGEVDVVFEVVGSADAVELAVRVARPGGRVVLVGIPGDDRTTFPASVARRKGLTLSVVRRMKEVYPRAIGLVERGVVDASALVTHRFPLAEVGPAFRSAVAREGLKVVVELPG